MKNFLPMFFLISLVRHLSRKGALNIDDFVSDTLSFIEESGWPQHEKDLANKAIMEMPRSADPGRNRF